MSVDSTAPIWIAALVATYAVLALRLKHGVQPLRLELAKQGELLIKSGDLNDRGRNYVRLLLNNAFGFRLKLMLMFFVVPSAVIYQFWGSDETDRSKRFGISSLDTKERFDALKKLHMVITFANHPFTTAMLMLWTGLWFFTCYLISAIAGRIPLIDGDAFALSTADNVNRLSRRVRGSHADVC